MGKVIPFQLLWKERPGSSVHKNASPRSRKSQRFFLIFPRVREPRSGEYESRGGEKEKTHINMIGLFDWYYRGDGGDICHSISWGKFCLSLPGKGIDCINTSQLDIGRFTVSFKIRLCSTWIESVFEAILDSVLEERFPDIESLTEHQRKALITVINRNVVFAILPTGHRRG